ncbi:MAG: class II SORL domain-containing protein [Clostridiales bacterium]|nr:class II SORL domain-containing protein [Clostridiales bacterium]
MSDAPILGPVNHIVDLDAASDFERKHTPFISAERDGDSVRVTIVVGHYVSHPNQPDHFIQWIELYADGAPIVRVDLAPVAASPDVSFVVSVPSGTTLRAVEYCNLHGLWAAEISV